MALVGTPGDGGPHCAIGVEGDCFSERHGGCFEPTCSPLEMWRGHCCVVHFLGTP